MLQFIRGSDAAFADLERRARRACVTFQDQQMPPGTRPETARIGFEINSTTGEALLLVDRGLHYTGSNTEVQAWIDSGTKHFPNFARLREWIRHELASAYQERTPTTILPVPYDTPATPDRLSPVRRPRPRPEDLTDMEEVRANLPDHERPFYISADTLFHELKQHVLGQDEALRFLARRVSRHLARRTPSHPATIFALGPTGVGKTRTAESLADALRALSPAGVGYSYLRLDMSEYQERYRVSQLLGSPQGYIGYDEGSQLLDALITNPKTVVVFDEIEKAHRDVFQSLMNAMDAGRFSSPRPRATGNAQGREVDCRSAIFFFTSNLDATSILKEVEEQNALAHPRKIEEICRTHLRAQRIPPELIGRINTFLVFQPLTMQTRAEILLLSIVRVAQEYGVEVAYVEPEVVSAILEDAQSEDFGARPDLNLVDDLLGSAFEEAARNYPYIPVKVCGGPPFECEPYEPEI